MGERRLGSWSRSFAACAAAAAVALAAAEQASAHAFLVRSAPEAGARLASSPRTVILYFSEPFVADSERITARAADGARIELPSPVRKGTIIRQPLPPRLPGVVIVNWAILSDDGHPSLGEFAFAVGAGALLPEVTARQGAGTSWGQTAGAWLFFAGLALALGGLVSERLLWRRRGGDGDVATAPVGLGLAAALAGSLVYFVALAADQAGGLAELDVAGALDARPGRLTALIVALLGIATLALLQRRSRALAIPALLVAAVVSAARGHSGTAGRWWAVPSDAVHLAAAAVWVGALVHLVRVAWASPADERRDTMRDGVQGYASLAFATVLVAIPAGLVTALAQFDSLEQLVETGYGKTLLVKGAVVGVALAVALAARTRAIGAVQPRLGLLRRVGVFELATGAVVLMLLALLLGSSPVQLTSTVLFAAALVVCAGALRHALRPVGGGSGAFVLAGVGAVVAINAGIVALGAAVFRDGWSTGGNTILGARIVLAALAGGLAVAAGTRLLARAERLRLPLLRRLTSVEVAALVGALAAAALLVNLAPPRVAEALAARAHLGPPPITGPAVRLGDLAGQFAVGVIASERLLRFQVVVPSEQPPEDLRLTAEAQPPRGLAADLYPRRCGDGCFTIRYRLPRGRTTISARVAAPGFEGGRVRFVIPWPPPPERGPLLRRVARTMLAIPELELTELVVSSSTDTRAPLGARLSGKRLLETGEMYRGGGVDVRVVDRAAGLAQLAFALPPSNIWYRMWIDDRYRVRREVIVNRGHRITRSFRYPSE